VQHGGPALGKPSVQLADPLVHHRRWADDQGGTEAGVALKWWISSDFYLFIILIEFCCIFL
jgi:hypothetical protein